ncbi:ABC transporter permease [Ornithinibacillus sp. 4-3]|uniref:ABC transporter permease n=1 Tax=Ornithinibacillus sp. 4-3 TaxID=3231488 RepID=A0AB39HPB4_9BACI
MGNLIKAEWYKLRKDRTFWFLILLLIATSIFYPLLIIFDEGAELIKISNFYQSDLLNANIYVIKLIPCVLAGFFISKEYSSGTMKNIVSSGNSRARIYFAKLIVFSMGAVIISIIIPIILTGSMAVYLGFPDMPEWSYFVKTIGFFILYAAAFASLMTFFATILTDTGKAIAFMIIFFQMAEGILTTIAEYIPYFEPLVENSIFYLLWNIEIVASLNSRDLLNMIFIPIISIAVFGGLGGFVFQKKEIK